MTFAQVKDEQIIDLKKKEATPQTLHSVSSPVVPSQYRNSRSRALNQIERAHLQRTVLHLMSPV